MTTKQATDSTKPSERDELLRLADEYAEAAVGYRKPEADPLPVLLARQALENFVAALLAEDKQVKAKQSERTHVDRGDAVNLARNVLDIEIYKPQAVTPHGVKLLCEAVLRMDAALLAADGKVGGEVVTVTDEMAYAFHRAITDGALSAGEVEEIKTGLRAALANYTRPQQAAQVAQPLTEERISELWVAAKHPRVIHDFARAIEAALGIGKDQS